jgi:hypothetical protein
MEKNVHSELITIDNSINKVKKWIEENEYKGNEPFDGLSSKLRFLTFKNLLLERILQQLVRQSPFNLRPFLGIKPLDSTKGRGYAAQSYMYNWDINGNNSDKEKAINCLEWLTENKSPFYKNHSWGNHFPVSFRGGHEPALEPIIVWTALIGQAFLDAYDRFDNKEFLKTAESAAKFIIDDLPREVTDSGSCISYVTSYQRSIHNANLLGAAFLARISKYSNWDDARILSEQAIEYSCNRQLPDGSWYYGEAENYHWIDNFHTGYNLDSLKCYIDYSHDKKYESNLYKGLDYFTGNFIEASGRPKYYNDRTYPVDIQCAAQTIETLSNFSEVKPELLSEAVKVATWTIENMQHKKGYFFYRQFPLKKVKIPMLHWGQATMFKGLSLLVKRYNCNNIKESSK